MARLTIPANQQVPFNVILDHSKVSRAEWLVVRDKCRHYGCKKWDLDEKDRPIWPHDCSEECRAYVYLEVFGNEKS